VSNCTQLKSCDKAIGWRSARINVRRRRSKGNTIENVRLIEREREEREKQRERKSNEQREEVHRSKH